MSVSLFQLLYVCINSYYSCRPVHSALLMFKLNSNQLTPYERLILIEIRFHAFHIAHFQ